MYSNRFLKHLFKAYIILTLISLCFYEPLYNEAQMWLLAKDMGFDELFANAQYSEHLILWPLILFPFAKLGLPFITESIINLLVIYWCVYIFLFRSPFPKLTKCLFIFSSFMMYEYAFISGGYALFMLLLFMSIERFSNRYKEPVFYSFLIFLMMNINILSLGCGTVLMFLYIFSLVNEEKDNLIIKKIIMSIPIMMLGFVIALYQVNANITQLHITSYDFLLDVNLELIPNIIVNAFTGIFRIKYFYDFNFWEIVVTFLLLISILLLVKHVNKIKNNPLIFRFMIANLLWLFYVSINVNYNNQANHGFILIYFIVSAWLVTHYTQSSIIISRHALFLNIGLVLSLIVSITLFGLNIVNKNSDSLSAANFMKDTYLLDHKVIAHNIEVSGLIAHIRDASAYQDAFFFPVINKKVSYSLPYKQISTDVVPVNEIMERYAQHNKYYADTVFIFSEPLKSYAGYGLKQIYSTKPNKLGIFESYPHESYWMYVPR